MVIRILMLLAPATLLLGAAGLLADRISELPPRYLLLLDQLPYAFALVTAALAYGFNRNQILFATLNLTATYLLIQFGLQTSLDAPHAYVLFSALSLLLPFNVGMIATYQERGLFTPIGLVRLGAVLCGYLLVGWLWLNGTLGQQLVNLPPELLQMVFENHYLTEMAAVFYAVAALIAVSFFVMRRGHSDAGVLASLAAGLVMTTWFDQPYISALMVSAALIAMGLAVVQNSHSMAYLDELTEIPARRALQDKLAKLGRRYTVAMVDIDHFKKFNDTYGHDIGDQVLRMVAKKLASVSGGGKAYRYGGEEFTLVFAGKDEEQALPYAEQIRELIANYPMRLRSDDRPDDGKKGEKLRSKGNRANSVSVTISIGLAEKTDAEGDPAAVIKEADKALYEAKRNGRNCSVTAHHAPAPRKRGARRDYA